MSRRAIAVILLAAAALLPACMLPDDKPRISIEFGAVPELEGAHVLIDGKPVGKLERTGAATRIAFPVEKGIHEVTLRHSDFDCEPARVKAELDAQKIRLLAQVSESPASLTGSGRPTITLRW